MDWIELTIKTNHAGSEAVSAILLETGVISGVSIEDPMDILDRSTSQWDYVDEKALNTDKNTVTVKAYISVHEDAQNIINSIKDKLTETKQYMDIGEGSLSINNVKETDWSENWKQYYKPVEIGERVIIKPTWENIDAPDGKIVIEMDPGMAFGTGTHETTRMCVDLLQKYKVQNKKVLDLGTGSGILGITAVKLGAKSCLGVDIDKNAVKTANENARINNISDSFNAIYGNLTDVVTGKFDIVTANIIADAICMLNQTVAQFLADDGVYITSGIINTRVEDVKNSLAENGFKIIEECFDDDWVAIVSQKNM